MRLLPPHTLLAMLGLAWLCGMNAPDWATVMDESLFVLRRSGISVALAGEERLRGIHLMLKVTRYTPVQDPSGLLRTTSVLLILNKPRVPYGTNLGQPQGMCPPHQ